LLKRDEWLDLARELDWDFSYVSERDVFPDAPSGLPFLSREAWEGWEEPFKTTFAEYVGAQHEKEKAVTAVRESVGNLEDFERLSPTWLNALKLHAATLPLAEFAAVVGNLRMARFGRHSAWRQTALLGALDELRHTQIPLSLMHGLVKWDVQFDWTHKFYHSNNWVAIAARHLADELLLGSSAVEFAVATNFVFEQGFTNVQFLGLSSLAHEMGDKMFEKMVTSIQSDEARHAQMGPAVLEVLKKHDPERAQYLLDKWFWRSWLLFAVVTGFSMDYFTPLEKRTHSFKEFMEEWVLGQYLSTLKEYGLKPPWYWDTFLQALDSYHHMVYASAYTYRASVWFNFVVPSPDERKWLKNKYPRSWDALDSIWDSIASAWKRADPGNDFAVHGTAIVGFCDLCQLVLCNGTPEKNSAIVHEHNGRKYIFCSEPCRWIFESEPERYRSHKDVVKRVLAGEAPANLLALVRQYFGLSYDSWGKDTFKGVYPWLIRGSK
jgi:toluene monooxygenase system protein A